MSDLAMASTGTFHPEPWKTSSTFPPRTTFIPKGMAILLPQSHHFSQNSSCPQIPKDRGRAEFPSSCLDTGLWALATVALIHEALSEWMSQGELDLDMWAAPRSVGCFAAHPGKDA